MPQRLFVYSASLASKLHDFAPDVVVDAAASLGVKRSFVDGRAMSHRVEDHLCDTSSGRTAVIASTPCFALPNIIPTSRGRCP
jgi:hypothetical protein